MSENRLYIPDDMKKQVIDLPDSKIVPPAVGIYDEPVRYYKANEQWAAIIEGLLSWLTEITGWRDAEDEDYIGIQAILEFIEGIEIVPEIDITSLIRYENCELQVWNGATWQAVSGYDESCFTTEAELTAALTPIEAQIVTNTNNISTNAANITANANEIAANAAAIQVEHDRIDVNIIAIGDNTVAIGDLTDAISDIDDEIADLDDRVTALENAAGGGGATPILQSIYTERFIGNATLPTAGQIVDIPITALDWSEYDDLIIRAQLNCVGFSPIRIGFNGDNVLTSNVNYDSIVGITQFNNQSYIAQASTALGTLEIIVQRLNEDGVSKWALATYSTQAGVAGNVTGLTGFTAWNNSAAITDIRLFTDQNMVAGTQFSLYGRKQVDVVIGFEPTEWQAFIDFRNTDAASIVTVEHGDGYEGDHYQGNSGAGYTGCRIEINLGEVVNITRIDFEYYCFDATSGGQAYIRGATLFPKFAEDAPPILDMNHILSATGLDVDIDTIGLNVNQTLDGNVNHDDRIYSVRIFGTGSIPASLTPYQV